MKDKMLSAMRRAIRSLPRSKVLNYIAQQYTFHYFNQYDSDFNRNGERRLLRDTLTRYQSPVVIDVGANIGEWSAMALEVNPNALVHAFEPVHSTYQILVNRLRQWPNATCIQKAMGDAEGTAEIQIYHDAHTQNSLHGYVNRSPDAVETITITTVDKYCETHHINHIHYLKIDTQGHDFAVLRGAATMLEAGKIDYVQVEYSHGYVLARVFLKDIFDLIAQLPYHIYRILPTHIQYIPQYHEHYENFAHCDYIIIRNDITPSKHRA